MFLAVAAILIFGGAGFLAITQIVVYVGGVLILMIFGVMLSQRSPTFENKAVTTNNNIFIGGLIFLALVSALLYSILKTDFTLIHLPTINPSENIEKIGKGLLSYYILPFEIIGFLLLIALVGAIYIAAEMRNQQPQSKFMRDEEKKEISLQNESQDNIPHKVSKK